MSKFKVGDRVREISTGDEGIFVQRANDIAVIKWTSGEFKNVELTVSINGIELVESAQNVPKLRWLQVEYVSNSDHPMAGLNRRITTPVLQYFDGNDWQTVETVLETRDESV